jgi:2-desacetyl-2-hydroxyethyl bacteriochlorophyllide A dehydrogenase
MKALKVFEPYRAEIVDVPEPVIAKGEALLRPKALGLCGTDLAIFEGRNPLVTYPRVIGHELAAEVIDVDDPTGRVQVGHRIAVLPMFWCGRCSPCRRGRNNCCVNLQVIGVHRDGAASEEFAMPVDKVHAASRTTDWESLAMVETMTIGYHAVNRAGIAAGEMALVIGTGPVGLGLMQAARLRGARVAAADIKPLAVRLARELGADMAVNNADTDLATFVRDWTSGEGPAVVFEAAGATEMMEACVRLVGQAGRVVIVGYAKGQVTYAPEIFVKKELDILGSRNSQDVFPEVLAHVAAGRIRVREMITHRLPFEQGVEALRFWAEHAQDVCKIVLTFS